MTDTKQTGPVPIIPETPPTKVEDESQEDAKVSAQDVENFELKIRSRSDPFTYLSTDFTFERMDSNDEIVLCSVLRALFACSPFVDKLRQQTTVPVTAEIRKLITKIAYNKKRQRLDVTNVSRALDEEVKRRNMLIYNNNGFARLISILGTIWGTSRFRKLFSLTRITTMYCTVCKFSKNYSINDFIPFTISKKQAHDPAYDLEDSLYAERVARKFTCEKCNTVTDYSVLVTTGAPDILPIMPPPNTRFTFPTNITLPCEESRTHYYTLASFIYTLRKDNRSGVCVRTGENEYKCYVHKIAGKFFQGMPHNNIVQTYNLLCYVKVASIDNYARVLE